MEVDDSLMKYSERCFWGQKAAINGMASKKGQRIREQENKSQQYHGKEKPRAEISRRHVGKGMVERK